MAAKNGISRMTKWRMSQVQDPELKEKLRAGEISARAAYRKATGDRHVQMNVKVQPWVRETFKEIAAKNNMTLTDLFSALAAELG
jgi:hypothetical protein